MADNPDTTSLEEDEFDGDIVSRIARLEADLEAEKSSFSHRFGVWAGLVALVISIAAGGIGIYDRVLSELERDERKTQEAKQIARGLSEISLKAAEVASSGDPMKLAAMAGPMNIEILNHLSSLEALGEEVLKTVETGDLVLFSENFAGIGRQEKALEVARIAQTNARSQYMNAIATNQVSRVLYADGPRRDLTLARSQSEEAIEKVTSSQDINRFTSAAQFLVSRSILEAYSGNCENSADAIMRLKSEIPNLPNATKDILVRQAEHEIARTSGC